LLNRERIRRKVGVIQAGITIDSSLHASA
jgi:hypothetical protein